MRVDCSGRRSREWDGNSYVHWRSSNSGAVVGNRSGNSLLGKLCDVDIGQGLRSSGLEVGSVGGGFEVVWNETEGLGAGTGHWILWVERNAGLRGLAVATRLIGLEECRPAGAPVEPGAGRFDERMEPLHSCC